MHWIDPSSLRETRGRITHFLLNPEGRMDGLLLNRGRVVHFPPHMARAVAKNLKPGDEVRIRAVRPKGAPVLAAVSLTAPDGTEIVDEGPGSDDKKKEPRVAKDALVTGTVVASLFGPKGELRGAFLDTGVSLRMPPHAAKELTEYLSVGARIEASGKQIKSKWGCVLAVDEIGFAE